MLIKIPRRAAVDKEETVLSGQRLHLGGPTETLKGSQLPGIKRRDNEAGCELNANAPLAPPTSSIPRARSHVATGT